MTPMPKMAIVGATGRVLGTAIAMALLDDIHFAERRTMMRLPPLDRPRSDADIIDSEGIGAPIARKSELQNTMTRQQRRAAQRRSRKVR